jgi:hypothetical protein
MRTEVRIGKKHGNRDATADVVGWALAAGCY